MSCPFLTLNISRNRNNRAFQREKQELHCEMPAVIFKYNIYRVYMDIG